MEDSAPRRHGRYIDLTGLPTKDTPRARRSWIYRNLVLRSPDYKGQRWSGRKETSLPWKVGKALCADGDPSPDRMAAKRMVANGLLARPKISAGSWDTFFRAVTNALPFSKRLLQAGQATEVRN